MWASQSAVLNWACSRTARRAPASHSGPQPLWGVESASAAFQRLLALGATELEPVTDVGEGIKVAAVLDPFGNRLGIIENPNFKVADVR